MRRWSPAALLLGLLAPAAHAQFSLYQVSGTADLPVGALFSFGSAYPNLPDAATFVLRNTTSLTQTVELLSISGYGFSLSGAQAPVVLQPGGSVQFTVAFQGTTVASYSGSLEATGISVSLTAQVNPTVTYEVVLPSGAASPLGAAAVGFGGVQIGSNATVHFEAVNLTADALTVDPISVTAGDFALVGPSPGGTVLGPQESAGFSIHFSPTAAGTRTALLSIGNWRFPLTGTGVSPPFSLSQVLGTAEVSVGAQFSFPTAYPNAPEAVEFSILNTTSQTQPLAVLLVSGAGFSLTGAAAPMNLPAGGSAQFTVTFLGAAIGSYSGSLDITGIPAVALTATVALAPVLTYEVQLPSGTSPLGTTVNFGSVQVGSNATVNFLAINQSPVALTVDAIGLSGDFALVGPSPSGTVLAPGATAGFSIQFSPTVAGTRTGVLSIGSQQFTLTGAGAALTYAVQLPSGTTPLGTAAVNLGSVQVGSNVALSFLATNQAAIPLTVDLISVAAGDFALVGPSPSGRVLGPGASVGFSIGFSPTAAGTRTAVLSIGNWQFTLTGTGAVLTYELRPTSTVLSAAGVNFGNVQLGSNATLSFLAL
ncbi:MAG: choice-of-anchor D domain-containing protein, partial [Bryobacteraceae bacterium]